MPNVQHSCISKSRIRRIIRLSIMPILPDTNGTDMDIKSNPFQGYGLGQGLRPVDNLWITRRDSVQKSVDNSMDLTRLLPSSSASERLKPCSSLRRLAVVGILCSFIASLSIQMQTANASDTDMLKLYAHSKIVNYKQFHCFIAIINKESHWDRNAINGSHFGLGQMKSKHYRNLDSYRQIDSSINYITKRYGSMCNAWRFHQRHGWY
jgi:hypothetical protein